MDPSSQDTFSLRDIFRRERLDALLSASVLIFVAYLLEHFANLYAFLYLARPTSNHVGDIFLDNIPVVNLNFLIVETAFVAIILGFFFVLSRPRYVLFTIKSLALFVAIRAVFISLTHVGIYPDHVIIGLGFFDQIYQYLNFQTGPFFSGHTGLPMLMALIFWKELPARVVFLALSFVFGISVLLAHVHYSIDVLAAPFMAYGIFKLSQNFFPRDYKLIEAAPSVEKLFGRRSS